MFLRQGVWEALGLRVRAAGPPDLGSALGLSGLGLSGSGLSGLGV